MQDERRPAGAVVVLGAAQYNGRPSPIFQARLQHAVDLFKTGQYGYLFVTGGKQPGDRTTEAAAGRQFAIDQGVPADRILMEDQGRNTLESLDAVRTTLAAKSIHDAVFVSDRSHMLRVLRIASRPGDHGLRLADARQPRRQRPGPRGRDHFPRAGRPGGVLHQRPDPARLTHVRGRARPAAGPPSPRTWGRRSRNLTIGLVWARISYLPPWRMTFVPVHWAKPSGVWDWRPEEAQNRVREPCPVARA